MLKRPALISVTQGTPRASSRTSKQKTPDARRSTARTAASQTSATRGSDTILASAATEASPGWPPNGATRSNVFVSTRAPSCQRLWQLKSRPGRYSDRVHAASETAAHAGDTPDIGIRRRDEQVDLLPPDDPPERSRVIAVRRGRHQVFRVRRRALEGEPIVVTAHEHQRGVAGSEASEQV